jgi:hypothetical protein
MVQLLHAAAIVAMPNLLTHLIRTTSKLGRRDARFGKFSELFVYSKNYFSSLISLGFQKFYAQLLPQYHFHIAGFAACIWLAAMSTATASFLSYWSRFTPTAYPFVHPEDTGSSFLADFELSMLPIPFVGDLREAEAIILMLNPGLKADDAAWEQKPAFRSALERNLTQIFPSESHPNFYLDPAFNQHPGAGYWSKSRRLSGKRDLQKLFSVVQALSLRDNVSVAAAQAHVSRKVAIVQLAPYHSANLKRRGALCALPSSRHARAFVHGLISERSKLVIAARSVAEWGLAGQLTTSHLVVYKPTLGASASLSEASEGGRALLNRLSRVQA